MLLTPLTLLTFIVLIVGATSSSVVKLSAEADHVLNVGVLMSCLITDIKTIFR